MNSWTFHEKYPTVRTLFWSTSICHISPFTYYKSCSCAKYINVNDELEVLMNTMHFVIQTTITRMSNLWTKGILLHKGVWKSTCSYTKL